MDKSDVKRVIELEKDGRKILVTLWDGDQISSCVEEAKKEYCEFCQGNDEVCRAYVEHLKSRGYQATEIGLGALEVEERLPKFLEEREVAVEPKEEQEEGD